TTRAYRVGRRRSVRVDIRVLWWRNRQMARPWQAVSVLAALARNGNLRRVELAWGASVAAELTHFVAVGVFAYTTGGPSAVGIARLGRQRRGRLPRRFRSTAGRRRSRPASPGRRPHPRDRRGGNGTTARAPCRRLPGGRVRADHLAAGRSDHGPVVHPRLPERAD